MYTLIIEDRHGRSAAEISFDQGSYTIGRVDGNDVVLPSSSVSRSHARIFVSNNKCYIDDLGSANGVFVDNVAIKSRTEIKNGSKIRIGEYTLYLEYKDQNEMNAGQDVLKTQIVSGGQSGYKIVRIGDKFAGEEFMLSETTNSIGRTEDNYILLSDNSISRNHAKITNHGMTFVVTDLESSNGTFVNNKKITGDCTLNPGDQVRFGNVSFVFVPSSERVDVRQFAHKKKNDNKQAIVIILIASVVIILLLAVAAVIFHKKDGEVVQQPQEVEDVSKEKLEAELNSKIDQISVLVQEKHFSAAQKMIDPLLAENRDNAKLKDLNKTIEFEIKNEKLIADGNAFLDNKKYEEAIVQFKSVEENSVNYETAMDLIKDTERKIRMAKFNDARSHCDDGMSQECIEDLCAAALALGDSDSEKERLQETFDYMERISKNKKNKYSDNAKECLKKLKE